MSRHRAGLLQSQIERLEERGLLSVSASVRLAHLDLPDGLRGDAEVAAPVAARPASHLVSGESGLDATAHTPHAGGGTNQPPPTARGNAGEGGAFRRSAQQGMTARELLDPIAAALRRFDPAPAGEPVGQASEIPGLGGSASELTAGTSVVGWAPGAAPPVVMSVASAYDPGAGLGGRAKLGPGSPAATAMPPGSFGNVAGLELGPGEVRTWPGPLGDGLGELSIVAAAADRAASSPARAELLDGALDPDWEAIDREMRRLLGRIGGLADTPDAREAGWAWLLWIGAATVLYLSHRASSGPRLLFRRAGPRAARAVTYPPSPVGPWPLGPP